MTRVFGGFCCLFQFPVETRKNNPSLTEEPPLAGAVWSRGFLAVAEDGAVAGPGVFVELVEVLNQFGA